MQKIGMRNIKTGIAVFFATLAGYLGIVETPVYTVSVCIFSIKNTMKNSLEVSWTRILGTLLGGVIGYLCTFILPQAEHFFKLKRREKVEDFCPNLSFYFLRLICLSISSTILPMTYLTCKLRITRSAQKTANK